MRSAFRTGVFAAATLLGIASGANAQWKPCKADAARLCPGMKPGSPEMVQCIRDHRDQVSPACKEAAREKGSQYKQQKQEPEPQQNPPEQP
jgi:hypothetical protein